MFTFRLKYFLAAGLLLFTEIAIALYAHDRFIRPYAGDFLVVILIYCFVRSFLKAPVVVTAFSVLLFAYCVEISQYFQLVKMLGLQHSRLANIILGNSFEWIDMLAYTLGIILVIGIEKGTNIKAYLLPRKTER